MRVVGRKGSDGGGVDGSCRPGILHVWPVKGSFLHIPMNKPGPRDEGGLSEAVLQEWLEAHMLGLWPENEGAEDSPLSED